MTKFQLNRSDGPWEYPHLGFVAAAGAILDGSLSTPPLTVPPDAFWSVYGGASAETGITRIPPPPAGPTPTPETTDGYILAYDAGENRAKYRSAADVIDFLGDELSASIDARVNTLVPDASTSAKGKVRLATTAETATGTAADRAVTPAGAAAAFVPLPLVDGTAGQILTADPSGSPKVKWSSVAGAQVFQHARGVSEEQGDSTYSNGTFYGYGVQMLWAAGGSFNQILLRLASTATTEDVRVRVFQVDAATGFTPTGSASSVLKADVTVPAAAVPHGTTPADFIVSFGSAITIAANKYVMVVVTSATVGVLTIGRWTTDPSTDRPKFFLMTSATAGSYAGTGFYSPAVRLLNGDPAYTAVNAQAAIAATAAASAQASATAAATSAAGATIDTPTTGYENTRGATERAGDTTYGVAGFYGFAVQQLIASAVTFNELVVQVATVAGQDVTMRLYQVDTATGLNLAGSASSVLKHTQVLPGSSLPSAATLGAAVPADVDVTLSATVSIAAGKYLVAVFSTPATGQVAIKRFTTDPSSDRPKFYLLTSPTAVAAGSTGFYSPSFTLITSTALSRTKTLAQTALTTAQAAAAGASAIPRLLMPPKVHAVVGDTLQLFRRGLVEHPNPYVVPSRLACAKGSEFPRYFEYTPLVGDVGTQVLTGTVQKVDGTDVATGTTNIVVKATQNPATVKRAMIIGDSTMPPDVATEVYRRLHETGGAPAGSGLTNLALLGSLPLNSGYPGGYFGFGGWTLNTYLGIASLVAFWVTVTGHGKDASDQKALYQDTNGKKWFIETIESGRIKMIAYDGATTIPASGTLTWVSGGTHTGTITYTASAAAAGTPFWNPAGAGSFSIKYWCDTYAAGAYPDHLHVDLGWNSIVDGASIAADYTAAAASWRTFLNSVHSEFPSATVSLAGLPTPSPTGGLGTNYNATGAYSAYYRLLRAVNGNNLMLKGVAAEAAYSGFVEYVDQACQFDAENNYPASAKAVNARSATTEQLGTNGIHPATPGYLQKADVIYRVAVHKLAAA